MQQNTDNSISTLVQLFLNISCIQTYTKIACSFQLRYTFLLNENLCTADNQYVKELLETFLTHFYQLYGVDLALYYVHSLIHLPVQALQFGSLDNISSFPFENHLQKLKRPVRKPEFPL